MDSLNYSDILVAVLGILSTGLIFVIREQREKIKTVRNQLSEKKYKVYNEVFSIFFDNIKGQKLGEKQLAEKVINIKKDLLIYAPDNVLSKFLEWNRISSNNPQNLSHASMYFDLCILIRKDMGHKKTNISKRDILRSIMTTDEEFEKMWKMINP